MHYEVGDIWEVSFIWQRPGKTEDGAKTTMVVDSYNGPALITRIGPEDNVYNKKTGEILIARRFITVQFLRDGEIHSVSNFHNVDLVKFIGKGNWKLENWMEA